MSGMRWAISITMGLAMIEPAIAARQERGRRRADQGLLTCVNARIHDPANAMCMIARSLSRLPAVLWPGLRMPGTCPGRAALGDGVDRGTIGRKCMNNDEEGKKLTGEQVPEIVKERSCPRGGIGRRARFRF